jgi:hypothetical protein
MINEGDDEEEVIVECEVCVCEWVRSGEREAEWEIFDSLSDSFVVSFCESWVKRTIADEETYQQPSQCGPWNVGTKFSLLFYCWLFISFLSQSSLSCLRSQEGLVQIQPNVRLIPEHKILIRADIETIRSKQVTLISGGGSFWNKFQ